MNSDLVPVSPSRRPAKIKDVLITVLALCLCLSLAALIRETRQHQEYAKLSAEQAARLQSQQQEFDRSLAEAKQGKLDSDRALRRAQITMKAGYEAQAIASRLTRAK